MSSTMGHSGKDKLVFLGYIEGAVGEGWNCGAEFFLGGRFDREIIAYDTVMVKTWETFVKNHRTLQQKKWPLL